MSIRISCWDTPPETSAGRRKIIIPSINLTQILHHDVFYKGAYVKKTLINFFVENNNLDHNTIHNAILFTREDTIRRDRSLSYQRDDSLRPHEETQKLVVCFLGAGLCSYYPDSTKIFDDYYLLTAITHLEVDLDDLRSFLMSNVLPLPSYLFPDERKNTLIFEGRLHNNKGFKEILSLDEIQNIVKHAPKKDGDKRKRDGLLPIITEYELNWNEITITFLDDYTIHIQFKDDAEPRRFNQAGFRNKRTNMPIKAWKAWYDASKESGLKFTFKTRRTIEKRAEELRKKLKNLFPKVKGNPIEYDRKEKIYKFVFQQNPPTE
jgi:hypothetical protein